VAAYEPNVFAADAPYPLSMEAARTTGSLVSRAKAGDAAALNQLLGELRPLVVQAARLVVGSGSWAAEDAAQEALLDITEGIGNLRDPTAVKTWALRVATRRALKVARRERLLRVRSGPGVEDLPTNAPAEWRQAALKQAFDRLPPRLRATAVLRLHSGLTEEETADALGCSVGTVKSNLHDARKRLTHSLTEVGFAPTVAAKGEL
jgi:RNA polymerase sigma factor (sigma-70 family)